MAAYVVNDSSNIMAMKKIPILLREDAEQMESHGAPQQFAILGSDVGRIRSDYY